MEVQKDFRDLLASLNKHQVGYVIVGAYALGFHSVSRHTGDLDLLIAPSPRATLRIMEALGAP
jgi:hypothetical protein